MAKKIVKVRCSKCGQLDDPKNIQLQGKSLVFVCRECGYTNTTNPDEDFRQAAANIVKPASENH